MELVLGLARLSCTHTIKKQTQLKHFSNSAMDYYVVKPHSEQTLKYHRRAICLSLTHHYICTLEQSKHWVYCLGNFLCIKLSLKSFINTRCSS